jgi:hypothetical protein
LTSLRIFDSKHTLGPRNRDEMMSIIPVALVATKHVAWVYILKYGYGAVHVLKTGGKCSTVQIAIDYVWDEPVVLYEDER